MGPEDRETDDASRDGTCLQRWKSYWRKLGVVNSK